MLGLSYIAVPLYQLFCQTYGLGVNSSLGAKHTDIAIIQDIAGPAIAGPAKQNVSMAGLQSGIKKDLVPALRHRMDSLSSPIRGERVAAAAASIKTNQVDTLKPITVYLSADNAKDLP